MAILQRLTIIVLALGLLAQCGKEDEDIKNVSLSLTPPQPFVSNGKGSIPVPGDDPAIEIPAAWLTFSLQITNGTEMPLMLSAVSFVLHYMDKNGNLVALEGDVDPFFHLPDATPEGFFLEIDKQSSHPATGETARKLYMTGLPTTEHALNLNYQVELTFRGLFGTLEAPVKNFEKTIYFTTN